MSETPLCDRVAVLTGADRSEVTLNCLVRHCLYPEISQHPQGVSLAGGLHDAGDHQIPEHHIINDVEAQPVIDRAQDVVKQA